MLWRRLGRAVMAIIEKIVRVFQCNACGYEWQRKKKSAKGKPRICPECKSSKWNKSLEAQKQSEPLMVGSSRPSLNQ